MIRELKFKNWLCFRNEHTIHLEPKAYAIVARYEIDPGRSNMGGKSAIPEGIHFTMTGQLAKFRKFNADGWITKGEKEGYFQITLEDGSIMRRARKRGARTEVTFTPKGQKAATQDDAEAAFYKHIGFNADDASTIVYFEQDMMNRIVRTEPEKRFQLIRGWLGLQHGENAEKEATEIVKLRVRNTTKLRAQRANILSMMPTETKNLSTLEDMEQERDAFNAKIVALKERRALLVSIEEDVRLVSRYDELVLEGKTAAEEVEAIPADLEDNLASTEEYIATQQSAWDAARKEVASKKKVSLGQFDGKCPVANIECPATKQINGDLKTSKAAHEAAEVKEQRAAKALQTAKTGAVDVRQEAKDAIFKRANLDQFRKRAAAMLDEVREARKRMKTVAKSKGDDLETVDEKIDNATEILTHTLERMSEYKAIVRQSAALAEQLAKCEKELKIESKLAATATVTRTTFRAAQRRVSERALDEIGASANKMLQTSGVDLSIDIQWEREGDGLAKTCEMCGAAFPTSAKVKHCESCDAERGQSIQQKLEFLLSDRSGAADDFAGIGLQLSAGSYLLRFRQSSWGMAMIDEPFAKMDRTIRKAAAKHLLALLGSGVYRQLMVISHSQDTVDIFPGRISITVARDGTRSIETR